MGLGQRDAAGVGFPWKWVCRLQLGQEDPGFAELGQDAVLGGGTPGKIWGGGSQEGGSQGSLGSPAQLCGEEE